MPALLRVGNAIRLNELQGQIALALDDTPRTAECLWVRLGKDRPGVEISGHFKSTLANLCRMQVAGRIVGRGYILAEGTEITDVGGSVVAHVGG
ncbi:MAG TPA: hypothetical protein VFE62_26630 [Gemmataceae bacterium]|nr:hypothetical protein [Gemmataceae bacterium]